MLIKGFSQKQNRILPQLAKLANLLPAATCLVQPGTRRSSISYSSSYFFIQFDNFTFCPARTSFCELLAQVAKFLCFPSSRGRRSRLKVLFTMTDQFTFKEVDVKLSSKESQEISTSPLLLSETTSVVYRPDRAQAKRNPS